MKSRMRRYFLLLLVCLAASLPVAAQPPRPTQGWIAVPGSSAHDYGVYYFRKTVRLPSVPATYKIRVSGDNRFILTVNGRWVCMGPARSDVAHWNYESIDLAPYLRAGENVVAAKVWNDGPYKPEANVSFRTGFMVAPDEPSTQGLVTDGSWLCKADDAFRPMPVAVPGYYAAGPGELVDMSRTVADWNRPDADLSSWQKAEVIMPFQYVGTHEGWGTYPGWMLRRSDLPQRELREQRLKAVRRTVSVRADGKFLRGQAAVTIPARTRAELLLDGQQLTNAYLTLVFGGGRGSRVTIGYAEALYDANMEKGNRNEIAGKHFVGRKDSLVASGASRQQFTTMAWRTYRYVLLRVQTADEPLVLHDIYGLATGYPFGLKAALDTHDGELLGMFDIGWRTARLCAVETYMDCPYYEQLQYFGDARIQALVTLYMTGDDRLVKNLLRLADWSRSVEGTTQSRYPSELAQWIQPYALHYIYTLHDYMMYGGDEAFLRERLMSERAVLDYFHHYQLPDGRVKDLPGWNFTDWVAGWPGWDRGIALPGADGCNSVMDFQLLYAYQLATHIEAVAGMQAYAELYTRRADQLKQTIRRKYLRTDTGLYADRSDSAVYSQHANSLAILTGMVPAGDLPAFARRVEAGEGMAPASIYFKYYLHEALVRAGLGDRYLDWLDKWRENIALGLTTWGETSEVATTRSDCHAWGASPNVEFFRTVLGISSSAPAFREVAVAPHLGRLEKIGGRMPHPQGMIEVSYRRAGGRLEARITLLGGVPGHLVWKGKSYPLKGGENRIVAP